MANELIEGIIPLAGPGFIAKQNGNFQPGEYKRLSNMEIDQSGFLVNRRNINSVLGQNSDSAVTPIQNSQRFLGNMGIYTLVTNGTKQWMVGENTYFEIWNALTSPGGGSSFARFVGFFRYNNKNHWLVLEFNQGVSIGLSVYYDASVPVPDIPETYAPGYQASLTREVLFTFAAGTNDFFEFQFKNFFLYKERLWIATSVGLYFSAATDPTDFVAPNGGFFKHPDNTINWAYAIKDNVYTLCGDAVYALTYTTDPNLDATERPLSNTIGGEMGCIHLDTPYFINNLGIFVINGNNVDKVMDSRFDYGKDTYFNRIFSFENYLVVNKYLPVNYDNNYSEPSRVGLRTQYWTNPESDAVGGTQITTGWSQTNSGTKIRTNLVRNPTLGGGIATNWFVNNFDTKLSRDLTQGHSDSNCLAFERKAGVTGEVDLSANNFSTAVTAGKKYAYSTYVKTGADKRIVLEIQWKNAGGVLVDTVTKNIDVPSSIWTRVGMWQKEAPAGATQGMLVITFKDCTNGIQYADDFLFEESSDAGMRSYFDGSTADSTFDDYAWTSTAHDSASTKTMKTVIPVAVTSVVDAGQPGKVLKFSGQINDFDDYEGTLTSLIDVWTNYTYTLDPVAAIVPNTPYIFRFDHKLAFSGGADVEGDLDLTVEYLDAANAVIGSTDYGIVDPLIARNNYTSTQLELVPPANTDKFRFRFELYFKENTAIQNYDLRFNRFLVEKSSSFSGYFTGASTDTASVTYNWTGTAFASTSTASPDTHGYLKNNGSQFPPFVNDNSLGYNTYFINTENGSTHVLDFMDQFDQVSDGGCGFIVDAITNPFKDASGNYKWVFLTNKFMSEDDSGRDYNSYVYYLSSSENARIYDFSVDKNNVLRKQSPKIDVEIDSYVPDGFEYKTKKFRSLMLQGFIPREGIDLEVAFDNSAYVTTIELSDNEDVLSEPRKHYAHRMGLNQRGHSITLRLINATWNTPNPSYPSDMEVSDIRALWSYTARLPQTKSIGS